MLNLMEGNEFSIYNNVYLKIYKKRLLKIGDVFKIIKNP